MRLPQIAMPAALLAALLAVPVSGATAQPYYGYRPWCNPFPLTWPFCVAGAAVGTAGWIATAPFRAVAHPYYYPPPPPPPPYYAPGYSPYYR